MKYFTKPIKDWQGMENLSDNKDRKRK